jgi:hypothetical protein
MGFVVNGVTALGQIFSEYFGFLCHSFHRLLPLLTIQVDTVTPTQETKDFLSASVVSVPDAMSSSCCTF